MFFAPPAVFCGVFATFGETSLLLFLVKSEPVGGLVPNMDQMKAWEKVGIQSGLIKALKPSLNSENSVYKYTGIGVFEERNSSYVSWILQQGI